MNRGTLGFSRIYNPIKNLVVNGDFYSDTHGWIATAPATIAWNSGGTMRVSRNSAAIAVQMCYQEVPVELGEWYVFGADYVWENTSVTSCDMSIYPPPYTNALVSLGGASINKGNKVVFIAPSNIVRITIKPTNNVTGIVGVDNFLLSKILIPPI